MKTFISTAFLVLASASQAYAFTTNKEYKGRLDFGDSSPCTVRFSTEGETVNVNVSKNNRRPTNVGSELRMGAIDKMFKELRSLNANTTFHEITVKSSPLFGGETKFLFEYRKLENGGFKLTSLDIDSYRGNFRCEFYN